MRGGTDADAPRTTRDGKLRARRAMELRARRVMELRTGRVPRPITLHYITLYYITLRTGRVPRPLDLARRRRADGRRGAPRGHRRDGVRRDDHAARRRRRAPQLAQGRSVGRSADRRHAKRVAPAVSSHQHMSRAPRFGRCRSLRRSVGRSVGVGRSLARSLALSVGRSLGVDVGPRGRGLVAP